MMTEFLFLGEQSLFYLSLTQWLSLWNGTFANWEPMN